MKNSKSKAKTKIHINTAIKITLVVLLVIVGFTFIAWKLNRNQQVASERAEQAVLAQQLTAFTNEVTTQLGEPVLKEVRSYCDRTGVKFGKGSLYCGTRVGMNFSAGSVEEAQRLSAAVQETIIKISPDFRFTLRGGILRDGRWSENFERLINSKGFFCFLDFKFEPSNSEIRPYYIGDSKAGTFGYRLDCEKTASFSHYPMLEHTSLPIE